MGLCLANEFVILFHMSSVANMPVPRALVFDLGKVLLEFDYSIAARAMSPQSQMDAVQFKWVLDSSPLLMRFESGGFSNEEFYDAVRQETGYRGSFSDFSSHFVDIFAEIQPMVALHQELRSRGIPTYIFSNTNGLAIDSIRQRFPFFGGFTGYVLSYEIKAMKPLSASYESVEAMTGLKGSDLLYLDDRLENVEGGQARGWQTIHHSDPAESIRVVRRSLGW